MDRKVASREVRLYPMYGACRPLRPSQEDGDKNGNQGYEKNINILFLPVMGVELSLHMIIAFSRLYIRSSSSESCKYFM